MKMTDPLVMDRSRCHILFCCVFIFNEKACFDFQYDGRDAGAVWQIDVCSQGGPIHTHRIDDGGGRGVGGMTHRERESFIL